MKTTREQRKRKKSNSNIKKIYLSLNQFLYQNGARRFSVLRADDSQFKTLKKKYYTNIIKRQFLKSEALVLIIVSFVQIICHC